MRWLWLGVAAMAAACGGKAVVDGKKGSGGAGGSGGNGATTASNMSTGDVSPAGGSEVGPTTTGPTCMETGTKHCAGCAGGGCVQPDPSDELLVCNDTGAGKSSLNLYEDYYGCMCGTCGAQCSKACTGLGTDASGCMLCLQQAVTGKCSSAYQACAKDT